MPSAFEKPDLPPEDRRIDVMFITANESLNLPHSLAALQGWVRRIFIVDSGSTDGSPEIARSFGAEVVHHQWEGYARQKNWGLANLPLEAPWTLILDADEVITPELRSKLIEVTAKPIDQVPENGFFINRLTYFLGRPIRHCGYYPSWNLRLFKRGKARYEDRVVHEHMIIEDPVGYIKQPMLHDDRRGLEHYVAKHNRYSTLEAKALYAEMKDHAGSRAKLPMEARWRRWLKRNVLPRVPMSWMLRFLYMYIIRLGVLDGRVGLEFCKFISMYDYLVVLKLRSLRSMDGDSGERMLEGRVATVGGVSATAAPTSNGQAKPTPVAPRESERLREAPTERTQPSTQREPVAAQVAAAAATGIQRKRPATASSQSAPAPVELPPAGPKRAPSDLNVSILILALNEQTNLPACLESIKDFDDVVVLDSLSTDRTVEIAQSHGARVIQRKFDDWSTHQNWAMENIDFKHGWVFYLDADERMTPELVKELREIAKRPNEPNVAFYCGRRNYFMGRWIRRSMPPGSIMRFFRPEKVRFERLVNPTPLIDGPHGYLKGRLDHYTFNKGLTEWIEKHNNYSRMEAIEGLKLLRGELGSQPSIFSRDRAMRRRALKNLSFRLPFRPAVKFLYMYFVRLGVLDGVAGLTYCTLQAVYEYMIVVKMREQRRREKGLPV